MKPPARPGRAVLDRIDLAILEALRGDGRMTYQALSERVGLSPRPCLERVRRLEQKGVIRGFTALLDPASVGHDIIALAEIAMRDPSAAARQRLERALCAHPSVVELQVVNGENDYVARIVAPTPRRLRGPDRGLPRRSRPSGSPASTPPSCSRR